MPRETSLDIFLSNLDLGTFECQTNNYYIGSGSALDSGHGPLSHNRAALEQVADNVRQRLESSAATMNVPNVPSKDILASIQAITGKQIAIWIRLYFQHFHKHGPVIHEATFNPTTAALPLVLAIMSIGAMVSPLELAMKCCWPFHQYSVGGTDAEGMRLLLDTIETCIFSFPALSDEYDLPGRQHAINEEESSLELQRRRLEELQAAYIMVVLQYWSGNLIARKRARQQRFSRIVAVSCVFPNVEIANLK
jgi:hypothetical protein